jgi:hypothetical protein
MAPYQVKAMLLANRIRKLIRSRFDDNDFMGALRLLTRWNCIHRAAFPGETDWTPGDMVDSYLDERAFESRF